MGYLFSCYITGMSALCNYSLLRHGINPMRLRLMHYFHNCAHTSTVEAI